MRNLVPKQLLLDWLETDNFISLKAILVYNKNEV